MKPPPNFDRLASAYPWLERLTFGDLLWQCRCAHLDKLRSCKTALVIGDGDGRFTARLLEVNQFIHIDAVDNSEAMLCALVQRAEVNSDRVRIHCADARTFTPPRLHYDLIVTHFFLDCLTTAEVTALANRLRTCLTPTAIWVISDFAVPNGLFGVLVARPIVSILYLAFALLTRTRVFRLPDHRRALASGGYSLQSSKEFASGLLLSEIWAPACADNRQTDKESDLRHRAKIELRGVA